MNVSKLADINIPQGRGMIKWAPFATMPEQFENVSRMKVEQVHVPKPNLTDELQQDMELKLRELLGQNVILRYWQSGYEYQVECVIESLDDWSRVVTVRKEDSFMFVQFEHIYSVDEYDYMSDLDCLYS
ncbi:YolD-like family protein [Jeotgalicoccus halotolerans]|uniref:YolD-like protein n=1 Tax=Jeotgalicoccus halotolerans TaxID=157227 RepID=A0A3E0B005_9STAP|nr:YolD-like family protein [Jeotgalicoccus halotolerans]REG25314.1 YolD-like protein [Jeotgalicoccus halotolerans]